MKNTEEKALNQEIDKQIEKAAAELSTKYPGQDVKLMIIERLLKERGTEIQRSEIDRFKEQAISSLGTDHEIAFNDAERGFLQAALSDGRMGFKEFMESIPVETPLCEDGTKMANAGAQKKNLMSALGLVEGVRRVMYRDDALGVSEYPLDDKIGLLNIDGERSRYTPVFAWNTARLYAELTEADASAAINAMLGIEINKTQIARVAQAVAEHYGKPTYADGAAEETDTTNLEETESTEASQSINDTAEGFIAEKLRELDASPDRDAIIQAAIDGKLDGTEGAQATQTVLYLESDGTGVPGLSRELSDNGKNGGKAGTFEAKIGCAFQQGFTADSKPVLDDGNIARIPGTTKYIGTTEKIGGFRPVFTDFALRYGMSAADQIVFLTDGAVWLRNLQLRLCPNAIGIVDYYHAAEHLDDVINALRFDSAEKRAEFAETSRNLLERGDIGQLTSLIRDKKNHSNEETVEKKLVYFERNADRMRYGLFRAAGLFIGSGVMEAACKTIVGKRLKNAGMHWSKKNANGVIALRCAICSNEYSAPDSNPIAA